MKNKLYVLGDSFAANLFKEPWLKEGTEVYEFKKYFTETHNTNVYWWTDYIEKWTNYEVVNLGYGGCCNEDIIYQLGDVEPYKDGDRMIIHWTHNLRFKLYYDSNIIHANPHYIDNLKLSDEKKEFLIEMFDTRENSWFREDGQKFRKFLGYLYEINKDFKPIFTSIFPENIITMKKEPYFFNLVEMLRPECYINTESAGKFSDGHWGFIGNFRVALCMLSKLQYGDNFSEQEKIKISKCHPNLDGNSYTKLKIYGDVISKKLKMLI